MKRIAFQFTPYSWVRFEWKPASSLRRWLAVCGIILVVRPAASRARSSGRGLPPTRPCPPVSVGRAEHLLPEVRAVAAPGALAGPAAAGVLRERGRRGHAGDLRLHGRPVSRGGRGGRACAHAGGPGALQRVPPPAGSHTRSWASRPGWWPPSRPRSCSSWSSTTRRR